MCLRGDSHFDAFFHSPIHIPPETDDIGICRSPAIHQRLKFLLRHSGLQRTHCLQRTDAATIPAGQSRLFSFLAQFCVLPMLFHPAVEHTGSSLTVNVSAFFKNLQYPFLSGQPSQHSRFDGGKICHNEFPAILRHKCRADKLGEGIRDIFIEHGKCFIITAPHQSPRLCQIWHGILIQILQLDQPPGEPAGAVRPIKNEHPMRTAVCADCVLHRRVFLHAALGELLPEGENLPERPRRGLKQFRHCLFPQGVRFQPVVCQPLFHLLYGIRVFQFRQFPHSGGQPFTGTGIHGDGLPDQFHIHADSPVIDLLVEMVFFPDGIRYRKIGEPFLYLHFRLHIPEVICLEPFPFLRVMLRQVPHPASVCFGRSAGDTEIADQVFALRQLLLLQPQHYAHAFQGTGKAQC